MRKYPYVTVLIFAILGVVGAVLRYIYFNFCFDEVGLPVSGTISVLLIAVAVIAALAALVIAGVINKKYKQSYSFTDTFHLQSGHAFPVFQVLGAILLAASAVLQDQYRAAMEKEVANVFAAAGIIAAAIMIYIAVSAYKGKQTPVLGYASLVPAFYFCAQLIMMFASNAKNPIIMTFSFECIAIGAAALYICSLGGYALKKPQHFTVSFAGLLCITFSVISLTGSGVKVADILKYAGMIIYILPIQISFFKNLTPKTEE